MDWTIDLFPDAAADTAWKVDALFFAALAVTVFFSLLIATLIVVFAARYRRREGRREAEPVRESARLEFAWAAVPAVIALGIFGAGLVVYMDVSRPPGRAAEYYAVGKQWMWKFQHPEGAREINTLHLPVDTDVRLVMTSEDVIHSLYVPAFRVKRDVVPGRYSELWFRTTRTGRFDLFCAEYCGAEHSLMGGEVVVMERADYEAWLSGERGQETMAASGAQLFAELGCATCHRPDDDSRGPWLAGLFGSQVELADGSTVVADEDYVRSSILDPSSQLVAGHEAIMPTYRGQVSEEELLELLRYIRELDADGASGDER